MRRFFFLGICLILGPTFSVFAQDRISITKLDSPIVLDGIIDEPAWDSIEPFKLVQYEPVFKGEVNERTEIRVGYDEEFIYVSGKMYVNDSETIVANSQTRDEYSGDDVFAIILDPFNDNENGLWFFTTPAGARIDIAISNDAEGGGGGGALNSSWNTFWDASTTITDEGWFAEMRIPFSSIGFQDNDGIAEMGMIVYRWLASSNERYIFPEIEPIWNFGNAKPSQAQDIILEGVSSSNRPVYFAPYLLGGRSSSTDLNAAQTSYERSYSNETELGLDLKTNVTPNLTLDLSLNTDFAQVEADDQQLNLSRFSVFFPEKRQFFQERAGLFNVSLGRARLFYSRRIGLDDNGTPVRILGGARLTGKIGNWDVGVINMQTADSESLPSENFGVYRFQRTTFNDLSTIGALFTTRIGADGSSNYLYSIDSQTNVVGEDFLEIYATQSISSEIERDNRFNFDSTGVVRVSYTRRSTIGFNYRLVMSSYGENFDPGIGFINRTGNLDTFARFGYGWFAPESSSINRQEVDVRFFNQVNKNNFDLFMQDVTLEYELRFKTAGEFSAEVEAGKEILYTGEDFNVLGKIYVPVGEYITYSTGMSYGSPEGKDVRVRLTAGYGNIYDGTSSEFSLDPQWNVSTNLELGGRYSLTDLNFPGTLDRDQTDFTAHLTQFRARYAFNKKVSASSFIQYSNVAELVGANVRFRYNFSEGRDLWFVLNEQLNTNRVQTNLPNLPFSDSTTFLVKYTHTFIF